jgi:hypothetical protein
MGLTAFASSEVVSASKVSLSFSSAKAKRELGWTYRPPKELWQNIVDEELKLLAARKKRNLVSRLKPMEVE